MKIAVIGGGLTGLSAAYELSKDRHRVTLFEQGERIGGLAGTFRIGGTFLEKYYHHIFKSDTAIIDLIRELRLEHGLLWRTSPIGFFHKGAIFRFGTPLELLRFKPLGFLDRLRLGLVFLKFKRMKDWESLESETCGEWFFKHASADTYRIVWEPLLKLKFGEAHNRIPASWIWGRIHPRARSRSRGGMKEELGYLDGSFQLMMDGMRREIEENGGEIREGAPVDYIIENNDRVRGVVAENDEFFSDRVIATIPIPEFLKIAPPLPHDYEKRLKKIDYQSVICLVVESIEPLSQIYWLNISDPEITFGGVIEQTNFISPDRYGGSRIFYIFNYVDETHPYFNMSEEAYLDCHIKSLKKINPSFGKAWIKSMNLFKSRYGTVVYTLGYREVMPPFETPIKGLFMANTSQIYPYDRNMNNCIALGQRAAQQFNR